MKSNSPPAVRPTPRLKPATIAVILGLALVTFVLVADWGSLSIWMLRAKVPFLKEAAVTYLNKAQDPRAVDALIGALSDSSDHVREAAAEALGRIKDYRAVDPLLERLHDPNKKVSIAVIRALGEIGDMRAAKRILMLYTERAGNPDGYEVTVLGPEDKELYLAVFVALIKISGKAYNETLEARPAKLSDMDERDLDDFRKRDYGLGRLSGIEELRVLGGHGRENDTEEFQDILLSAINETVKDKEPSVRLISVALLAKIEGPSATEILLSVINDENVHVRFYAVRGLADRQDEGLIPTLLTALKDPEPLVRMAAIYSLSSYRDPRVIQALTEAIKDPNEEIRRIAVKRIGMAGGIEAVNALSGACRDPDEKVGEAAFLALSVMHEPEASEAIVALLDDEDKTIRERGVLCLAKINDPRALDTLGAIVSNSEEDVETRLRCISALGSFNELNRMKFIADLMQDTDPKARESVIELLRTGGRDKTVTDKTVAVLIGALKDNDPRVREAAADGLGRYHDPRVVEALIVSLKDSSPVVRRAANDALSSITRQHFGEDVKKWQEWWNTNKSKYSGDR